MILDYEEALRIGDQLLARDPGNLAYPRNISRTAGMLAIACKNRGRTDAYLAMLDRSYRATIEARRCLARFAGFPIRPGKLTSASWACCR